LVVVAFFLEQKFAAIWQGPLAWSFSGLIARERSSFSLEALEVVIVIVRLRTDIVWELAIYDVFDGAGRVSGSSSSTKSSLDD
jgi:hypothetical protein